MTFLLQKKEVDVETQRELCPISGDPATARYGGGDYVEYVCPSCGRFGISKSIAADSYVNSAEALQAAFDRAKRDPNDFGTPIIRSDHLLP